MAKSRPMTKTTKDEPRTLVKEVANAKLYSDGTIFIEGARCSYPNVLERYKGDDENAKAKFSIVLLLPKKKSWRPARELVNERIDQIMKENRLKSIKADNKFFRDGDLSEKDENQGNWTLNASEAKKVIVRDNVRDPETNKPRILKKGVDDDRIYGGCKVNALIRPWYSPKFDKWGKKINSGLVAVQFAGDGEPFGSGRISEDEIDDEMDNYAEDDEDAEDDDDDDDAV